MKNPMLRRIWQSSVLLASAAVLAACPGADRAERPTDAQQGGTVVVTEGADMDKPMPLISESSLDNQLQALLYRPLLQSWWEDGELEYVTHDRNPMSLARSYEFFGPDSASLRYRLVSDAVWSDGAPITAHDVVWTLESQGDPRVASPRQDYNRNIREVVAEDDSTVVIHFHQRNPEMFFHSAGTVAPRHVYGEHDVSQLRSHPAVTDPTGGNLVVSGPFMIGEWIRGQRVTLVPNPRWEPTPHLDRVVFRIIPEQTTRLIELQTGNVDMIAPVPFDQLPGIERQGDIRIERREGRFYDYIGYNPRAHEFFADRDIRRALGLAIDHEGVINGLQMEGFATPAGGPYSPIFRNLYDPREQAPLPFEPDEARRILAEKGWTPGPDGILRNPQGQPFRFTLTTNAGNQRRADVAQIVQQYWRRIGVDARIQIIEFNTFIERNRTRNFEAIVGGWGVGLSPDLQQIWGDPDLPFNSVSYDNAEVRRLIQEALAQPTEELAAPIWRRVAALIVADQPYTWLYYFDEPVGVRERVQGTVINTLSTYQNMWEWWVTDGGRGAVATP
jgi:peptide/nickel transport system substrate-binding protein